MPVAWTRETVTQNCFEKHLRDSIIVNQKVKKSYGIQSQGESDKVYRLLIASEKMSLLAAKYFDLKAKKYQNYGMDLLCQEFMEMKPQNKPSSSEKIEDYLKMNWRKHYQKIQESIKSKNPETIKKVALSVLSELNQQPNYHCFSRHMVESIYRFAYFINIREKESAQLGIKSPKKMLLKIISIQNSALWYANLIDEMSAPIQKKGIPLLCNELPDLLEDIVKNKEETYVQN